MENENNNIDVQESENKPEKEERLFTAKEVNEIVRKRLERERAKNAKDPDLAAKSTRLDCMEFILDNGLPKDLLDIIDTSNVEVFKEKAQKISGMVHNDVHAYPDVNDGGSPHIETNPNEEIAAAFKTNAPHRPKKPKPF